jgi:hypothetical protein
VAAKKVEQQIFSPLLFLLLNPVSEIRDGQKSGSGIVPWMLIFTVQLRLASPGLLHVKKI